MGWDWRLRTAASTGLFFIPRVIAMWTMVWWYRLGITPNSSTRVLWQPPVLPGASRRTGERNENLVYPSPWDFKRSYDTGPTSLLPIRWKVCCGFFAFKNPSPWLGSNPRPLGPVASTLTTTPPKATSTGLLFEQLQLYRHITVFRAQLRKWIMNVQRSIIIINQPLSQMCSVVVPKSFYGKN
jgi:hypothetical protein